MLQTRLPSVQTFHLDNFRAFRKHLEAGPECKEVGRNSLDTFRSSPVFAGKRMFLRTYSALYCIGV